MTETQARACQGKIAHKTKAEAEAHRRVLIFRGAFRNRITVYKCKHCDHWHVGHRLRRRR